MRPNDLGKKFIVEECEKIEISSFLNEAKQKIKEILLKSELDISGIDIVLTTSRTGFGGTRYWFVCPICNQRRGVLFAHPISQEIGCRDCLGLGYRKQRFKGMIENEL